MVWMRAHRLSRGEAHLLGTTNVGKTFALSSICRVTNASRNAAFRTCSMPLTLPSADVSGFYSYLLNSWHAREAQRKGVGLQHLLLQAYGAQVPVLVLVRPRLLSRLPALIFFQGFSPSWRKTHGREVSGAKALRFFFFSLPPQTVSVLWVVPPLP